MDDFLDANVDKNDDFQEQKKIVIKHRKIKRATRTFLYNIEDWLETDEIKTVSKKIKKKLGTSSQTITDDEGTALTFNGDHTDEIKSMMIEYSDKLSNKSFA
jgi:translation initiation factor 1 (eIF-1/SUI1)